MRAQGISKGDRVAVVLPATPEAAAIFFGVWKFGAILFSMSVIYGGDAIEHRLRDSGAALLVTDPANASRFDRQGAPDLLVLEGDTLATAPTAAICEDTAADDPAQLSGAARSRSMRLPTGGRLRAGAATRLPQQAPGDERVHDPDGDARDDVDRGRGRALSAAVSPRCSAGEPLNPEVIRWFRTQYGVTVLDYYGLTESYPLVGNYPLLEVREGSMGKPMPGGDVQILDEDDRPVAQGERGEICLRARSNPHCAAHWRGPRWLPPEASAGAIAFSRTC